MRIALFGGSFDPPHIGHQLACLYVLETHDVDEVWMLPCAQHPFAKQMSPFAHRVAMCRLAVASLPRVQVCTIEEEREGPSYTLDTVRTLAERYPQHELLLVIGADLLREREGWHGAAELCQRVRFIVLGRRHVETQPSPRPHAHGPAHSPAPALSDPVQPRDLRHAEPLDLPAVSSTAVRQALSAGKLPRAWVSRGVLAYIQAHGLYRPAPESLTRSEETDAIR
jgi:nicotinate-nucleotide adenylyltransferase